MPMKRRTVWLSLGIWACLWAGSLWYYDKQQLAQPVFFRHYYDLYPEDTGYELSLFYLSNRNQQDVVSISIPGFTERIPVNDEPRQTFRYHRLHRIQAAIPVREVEAETSVTQITVRFADEREQTVDIGHIRFRKRLIRDAVEFSQGGSSTDGSGFYQLTLREPITLQEPDTTHLALTPAELDLQLNGRPWHVVRFPQTLGKGGPLRIDHAFRFSADDPRQYMFYHMSLILPYRAERGKTGAVIVPLHHKPSLNEAAIQSFLETEADRP